MATNKETSLTKKVWTLATTLAGQGIGLQIISPSSLISSS